MAAVWVLGRDGSTRTDASRNLGPMPGGDGEGQLNVTASIPSPVSNSAAFSLAERELQKELLAAKMDELTLRGMR